MLRIEVHRAACESTAEMRVHCAVCGTEFELGPVFAWMSTETGPDELCERCLRGLCEGARLEGLDVAWKDAYSVYQDARARYTGPMATDAEVLAMSPEEQERISAEARLTLTGTE
jgi:hypothetical protein